MYLRVKQNPVSVLSLMKSSLFSWYLRKVPVHLKLALRTRQTLEAVLLSFARREAQVRVDKRHT